MPNIQQVPIYIEQGGAHEHHASPALSDFESGATLNMQAGSIFKMDGTIKHNGVTIDRVKKVAAVAVAGGTDTAGGLAAWANPEGAAIIITRAIMYVSTVSAGACTVSIGVAANGTTLNNGLLTALDVRSATGVFDNITDVGASGKSRALATTSQFVTVSTASGASAGLVGTLYIEYMLA